MSTHQALVEWKRTSDDFRYESYNRDHEWTTGSGITISAAAAPAYSGPGDRVDPEEAFVAAIASCHMLSFLAICARRRLTVDRYRDEAVAYLEKNAAGKLAVTRVELRPHIDFAGSPPDPARLDWLHERAHEACFIANSVNTNIRVLAPRAG